MADGIADEAKASMSDLGVGRQAVCEGARLGDDRRFGMVDKVGGAEEFGTHDAEFCWLRPRMQRTIPSPAVRGTVVCRKVGRIARKPYAIGIRGFPSAWEALGNPLSEL